MITELPADIIEFITEYQYLKWLVEYSGIDVPHEKLENARKQIPDGYRQLAEADDKPLYYAGLGFTQNTAHFKKRYLHEHVYKKK